MAAPVLASSPSGHCLQLSPAPEAVMTQPGLHTHPPAPATAPAPHASHARDTLDSDRMQYSVYYLV